MAGDPRRRQKKLERRAAKRKTKRHEIARVRAAGLPERFAAAASCPVHDCWISSGFDEEGIGHLCLTRRLPTGELAVANFLIDRYCLGVKDTLVAIMAPSEYEERMVGRVRRQLGCEPLDPPSLRKMVEGAVEYARGLGFSPDPDYARGRLLFGDLDAAQARRECEYGKGGKPVFISGPNDTPERCRFILRMLEEHCGRGNFEFMVMGDEASLGGEAGFGPDMLPGPVPLDDAAALPAPPERPSGPPGDPTSA